MQNKFDVLVDGKMVKMSEPTVYKLLVRNSVHMATFDDFRKFDQLREVPLFRKGSEVVTLSGRSVREYFGLGERVSGDWWDFRSECFND